MKTADAISEIESSFIRMEPTLQSGWVARATSKGERVTWKKGAWHHTPEKGAKPSPITRAKAAELFVTLCGK